MLGKALILKTSAWPPIERMVRRSFLFRSLVRRFIAGDTLSEALERCEEICKRGIFVSLDNLGENTTSLEEANAACRTYMEMLRSIAASPYRDSINISIKLTQCGFDLGDEIAEANFRMVLEVAREHDLFVRVDMESSAYTDRTINLIERVFADYKNTGTVLQSYLYRTPEDAKRLIAIGSRVRLVKGAYLEPESVAHPQKSRVDEAFVEVAKLLMKEGVYPAIATHDEKIIQQLKAFADQEGIEKTKFEWQMLYGIRRDLQESLRAEGYPVRVYVPFGDSWYPYFVRRLAERPANSLFILRSLLRG